MADGIIVHHDCHNDCRRVDTEHRPTCPNRKVPAIGYHIASIKRGVYGEASKIVEEANEFSDAMAQGSSVMALVELSDLIGSIEGFLAKHHPTITLYDLTTFAGITRRAFENNHRSPR